MEGASAYNVCSGSGGQRSIQLSYGDEYPYHSITYYAKVTGKSSILPVVSGASHFIREE